MCQTATRLQNENKCRNRKCCQIKINVKIKKINRKLITKCIGCWDRYRTREIKLLLFLAVGYIGVLLDEDPPMDGLG